MRQRRCPVCKELYPFLDSRQRATCSESCFQVVFHSPYRNEHEPSSNPEDACTCPECNTQVDEILTEDDVCIRCHEWWLRRRELARCPFCGTRVAGKLWHLAPISLGLLCLAPVLFQLYSTPDWTVPFLCMFSFTAGWYAGRQILLNRRIWCACQRKSRLSIHRSVWLRAGHPPRVQRASGVSRPRPGNRSPV